jgi:glycosyltransferase involved in cell wall biosynthesis
MWLEKSTVYPGTKFHFVAPSHWIANEARASSLLSGFPVTVIPNGLNTSIFTPLGKFESRDALNLPKDKKVILFGAISADTDRIKGMDLLIDALDILKKNDESFAENNLLVVFGTDNKFLSEVFPLPVVCLGIINNENTLARIYSAADLTVVPSRSESFGQVAAESLSCGTPVVAFNSTGLKDIVDHLETGYLANDLQPGDLAYGIKLIAEGPDICRQMSSMARQRAVERFDIGVTARMHLDLFESLIVG